MTPALDTAHEYQDDANLGENYERSVMFACARHAMLCIARHFYRESLGLPREVAKPRPNYGDMLVDRMNHAGGYGMPLRIDTSMLGQRSGYQPRAMAQALRTEQPR